MAFITKDRLNSLTDNFTLRNTTFSAVLNEARSENRTYATSTIFLSHSHQDLDKEHVKRTIAFLRGLGLRIYIDSDDSTMPPFTNAVTASKIKNEIKANKKFILLATNAAIISTWCNWELGFGDAYKYSEHIALFPLAEAGGLWSGKEYLNLYPRIEETVRGFEVVFPNGATQSLKYWLQS